MVLNQKKALVLAGGGSRGAYQIGVWQALREIDYQFSIVTGTSVGALNGAMIAQGDFDKAKWLWENITLDQVLDLELPESFQKLDEREQISIFFKEIIKNGGAEFEALKQLLKKCLSEEKVRRSAIDLGIVTVKIPGYIPCTLFQAEIPKGQLIDYLLASSACFPAMKSYSIEGKSYIDGGYYDNLPIELAQKRGATEIFAVDVDSFGLRRRYDKKKSMVHVLHPKEDLGFFLKFDAGLAKRNLQLGYFDTMKYFGKLDGIRYTFRKGSLEENYRILLPAAVALSQQLGLTLEEWPKTSLEKVAHFSIMKTLRKYHKCSLQFQDVFSCCLEFCADIFHLSSEKLYSIEEMNSRLCFLFKKRYQSFDHSLEKIFSAKQTGTIPVMLKEQLKEIDKKTLICLSYSLLLDAVKDPKKIHLLLLALCCIPKECLCALYISLMIR